MKAGETKACVNHPDRVGRWTCAKFSVAYCDECCRCPHPGAYCVFRAQCPIWQVCLEGSGERARARLEASADSPVAGKADGSHGVP